MAHASHTWVDDKEARQKNVVEGMSMVNRGGVPDEAETRVCRQGSNYNTTKQLTERPRAEAQR